MQQIIITANEANRRIDRVVKLLFPKMPLGAIYKNLRTGKILLNDKKTKPKELLKIGDRLEFSVAEKPKVATNQDQDYYRHLKQGRFFQQNFDLVLENTDLLIVNKPSGIIVHSGTGHKKGRSLTDLARAYLSEAPYQPRPVQRLDKETSGLVIFAKNHLTTQDLSKLMRERQITKKYLALVHGTVQDSSGVIDLPLAREAQGNRSNKIHVANNNELGKAAQTSFSVAKRFSAATLLEINLHTGRTHQIRVHLKEIGHPLFGDPNYSSAKQLKFARQKGLNRLFLHAFSLEFDFKGRRVEVERGLPGELERVMGSLIKYLD
jgi:RluA family pseudouridine synthase